MTMRKAAQRIPFRPNDTQRALLEQCFGARRFIYNQQVEAFNSYDKETNSNPEYPNVTNLKTRFPWLRVCPFAVECDEPVDTRFRQSERLILPQSQV